MTIDDVAIFYVHERVGNIPVGDGLRAAIGVDFFIAPGTKRNPAEWSAR